MKDFITTSSLYLIIYTFSSRTRHLMSQNYLYIKRTTATKINVFYFQILALLLFIIGQMIRTPRILLVLHLSISLMKLPEKFIMIRGINLFSSPTKQNQSPFHSYCVNITSIIMALFFKFFPGHQKILGQNFFLCLTHYEECFQFIYDYNI